MMSRARWGILIAVVTTGAGCGSDDNGGGATKQAADAGADASQDVAPDAIEQHDAPAEASGSYTLTVHGGYGSGTYGAGDTVHVWAAVRPWTEIITGWTGDTGLLREPGEWHTTLTMPARDVEVEALIQVRDEVLDESTYKGTTALDKRVIGHIPDAPVGLILMLHGTGGSAELIEKPEARYLALTAIARGYGVLATEAEEVAAGDVNGDGKIRWDPSLTASNVDFANLDALVVGLREQGMIGPDLPLFVMGMSNGGAMSVSLGAVADSTVAPDFPNLRFHAALSYCASGRDAAAAISTTPTGWLLCANDDNDQVSNAAAEANSAALQTRGVETFVDAHPASPLYDQRFMRVPGINEATSTAIANELRNAGFVDANGIFTVPTTQIAEQIQARPGDFPVLTTLGASLLLVSNQVRVMQAEHQLYSDWADRTMVFFDARLM